MSSLCFLRVFLFKSVTKRADMAKARIAGVSTEVEQYRQTRYISAAEATWRLLGYHVVNPTPALSLIHAHVRGQNNVVSRQTQLRPNSILLRSTRLQISCDTLTGLPHTIR